MSTLLTPIITQLEIDRDRLKMLVNGTETDTVQLENRVEYSISGQIRQAIDKYASELQLAQDASQQAQDAAVAAKAARDKSLEYRDASAQIKTDNTQIKTDVTQLRSETKAFRDEAEELVASASSGGVELRQSAFSLQTVYPKGARATEPVEAYPVDNLHLIAQPFDANSERFQWVSRRFEVVRPNDGFNREQDVIDTMNPNYTVEVDTTTTEDSHYLGSTALVAGDLYAWRFTDTYLKKDFTGFGTFSQTKTSSSEWDFFTVGATEESIARPTLSTGISTDGISVELSLTAATVNNSTNTVDHTVYRIYDDEGNIAYETTKAGAVTSIVVPNDVLRFGSTYKAKAQFIINTPSSGTTPATKPPVYSPWSALEEFSMNFVSKYETASVTTTGEIDVSRATTFRVNGAVNTTLTLTGTIPANRSATVIVFVQDSGGTITWPTEISWAGGNEPALGTTWTNVILFWTGSMWIGMESAKK